MVIAAAIMVVIAACGDDDTGEPGSPSPSTGSATPSPLPTDAGTATTGATPVSDDVIDLAAVVPTTTVYAKAVEDLVTGSTNAALGDFNGDGAEDLLVGAPQADGPEGSRSLGGEAYVIFGPLEGDIDLLAQAPDITIYGALEGDGLGSTVFAGDLNGDGTDDIMIGAPGVTAGFDPRTDQGRLYVFYGGDGLGEGNELDLADDVYDLTVTGSEGFSRLSTEVGIGDVNGDGMTDLVVSSPFAGRAPGSPPGSDRTGVGEIYVIFGTGDLTGEYNIAADDYDVLLSGDTEFAQFGASFAVADLNGDGYDDIATGAHRTAAANGRPSGGAAYVFLGSDDISGRISIEAEQQDVSIVGASSGAAFGFPLTAGDFNGDGFDDLAIGAQTETVDSRNAAGSVRVFFGAESLPDSIDISADQADVMIPGREAGRLFPSAIAAGDLNGDGGSDLVMSLALSGSSYSRNGGGLVYIVPGGEEMSSTVSLGDPSLPRPILGPKADARLGSGIALGSVGNGPALALVAPGLTPGEDMAQAGAVIVMRADLQ